MNSIDSLLSEYAASKLELVCRVASGVQVGNSLLTLRVASLRKSIIALGESSSNGPAVGKKLRKAFMSSPAPKVEPRIPNVHEWIASVSKR